MKSSSEGRGHTVDAGCISGPPFTANLEQRQVRGEGGREGGNQRRVEFLCLPGCLGSVAPQAALGDLVRKHLRDTGDEHQRLSESRVEAAHPTSCLGV